MPSFRPGFLLLAFSLLLAPVFAQQAVTTPTSDPEAVAIVRRSIVALSGGASVSDVSLTGTAHRIAGSDDEIGTATLNADITSDSRVSLALPSGNRTEIRNHAAGPLPGVIPPTAPPTAQVAQPAGAWSGPDGILHGTSTQNLWTDATWFFPALTLTSISTSPNYVLSYLGQETRSSSAGMESVLHISAARSYSQAPPQVAQSIQQFSRMDIYVDAVTLLPVALAFNVHPDSNSLVDIPTEIQFSGYQAVNGISVPLRVQKLVSDSLVLDLQLSTVILNSGLSATQFELQ